MTKIALLGLLIGRLWVEAASPRWFYKNGNMYYDDGSSSMSDSDSSSSSSTQTGDGVVQYYQETEDLPGDYLDYDEQDPGPVHGLNPIAIQPPVRTQSFSVSPSKTVTTYPYHVWLVKNSYGQATALFWFNYQMHCDDFWLELKPNNYVRYGSDACMYKDGSFELKFGQSEINSQLRRGRKTQEGSLDHITKLKFINSTGQDLKIYWVDYDGKLQDYSRGING